LRATLGSVPARRSDQPHSNLHEIVSARKCGNLTF
jgi:hypothetical protein